MNVEDLTLRQAGELARRAIGMWPASLSNDEIVEIVPELATDNLAERILACGPFRDWAMWVALRKPVPLGVGGVIVELHPSSVKPVSP